VNPLSESEAAAIWQVLVDHTDVGSESNDRDHFVYCQTAQVIEEWRFVGCLGAGGKFRRNRVWIGATRTESWTVDCYAEDLTDDRQAVIDNTNEALAELRKARV
jgi:hypothetical protein